MSEQDITSPKVFLGAYVKRLSATFGINNSPTNFEMDLVQGNPNSAYDVAHSATGINLSGIAPGTIQSFKWNALEFVGIMQGWTKNYGTQGETYSIRMVDPRIVFNNVQLILNGQASFVSMDNYFDIFSYYGNPVAADSTSNGTAFYKIRSFLETTGIMNIYGHKFICAFSSGFQAGTGQIPFWYRVNASEMSLDNLLQQVCNDFNMDYYAHINYSTYNPTGVSVINVQHIDRKNASTSTEIDDFITNCQASGTLINYRRGRELRSDPTSVVLQGPPLTQWVGFSNDKIFNYWGRTNDGTALCTPNGVTSGIVLLDHIVGTGIMATGYYGYISTGTGYIATGLGYVGINTMPLITVPSLRIYKQDSVGVYPPKTIRASSGIIVQGYYPGVYTMMASLHSQEAWEAVLFKDDPNTAISIGIQRQKFYDDIQLSNNSIHVITSIKMAMIGNGVSHRPPLVEEMIKAVYEATRSTADQYYGKAWMVYFGDSLWLNSNNFDQSELYPRIEFEPTSSAWSENTSTPNGIPNHPLLNGSGSATFRDNLGLVKPILSLTHYNRPSGYDTTDFPFKIYTNELAPNSYLIESTGTGNETSSITTSKIVFPVSVEPYEKCPSSGIVTLSFPIEGVTDASGYENQKPYYDFLRFLGISKGMIASGDLMKNAGENSAFGLAKPRPYLINSDASDHGFFIPLKRNDQSFGPFRASGSIPGGVRIINDSSLAPWTYGSYANFQTAGQNIVNNSVSTLVNIDSADLSIAGLPKYNIGGSIGVSANINGISIQLGTDGLVTNYNIKTFSLPAGRLTKLTTDKITSAFIGIDYAKKDINLDLLNRDDTGNKTNNRRNIRDALRDLATSQDGAYLSSFVGDTVINVSGT